MLVMKVIFYILKKRIAAKIPLVFIKIQTVFLWFLGPQDIIMLRTIAADPLNEVTMVEQQPLYQQIKVRTS